MLLLIPPRRVCLVFLLGLVLLLGIATRACSQEATPSRLERAKQFYQAGDHAKVITELEAALVRPSHYTPDELASIYLYLGLAYLAFDRKDRAHEAFAESLRLDPELQVDPILRSPEVEAIFERARWEVEEEHELEAGEEAPLVPLGQPIEALPRPTGKSRHGGVWRSFLVPGWGQIYGDRKKRGYAFLAGEIAVLGGAFYATVQRERAYDDYREAVAENQFGKFDILYDDYRSWRRTRNTLLAVAGGIWVFNILESFLNDPSAPRPRQAMGDWRWEGVEVASDGWTVRVGRRF